MNGRNDRRMAVRDESGQYVHPYRMLWDMDHLMDNIFGDLGFMNLGPLMLESRRPEAFIRGPTFMPLDLVDGGNEYQVRMEMPGLDKENVNISLEDQVLTISAKEEENKEDKGENFLVKERRAFNCRRSIRLPSEVMEDQIKARMDNGILHLTLPKRSEEKEKARTITIE